MLAWLRSGLLPFLRGLAEVLVKIWTVTSADVAPSFRRLFVLLDFPVLDVAGENLLHLKLASATRSAT